MNKKAFSLIEVIVSISILVYLCLGISKIFDVVQNAQKKSLTPLNQIKKNQFFLDQLSFDFENLILRKDVDFIVNNLSLQNDNQTILKFLSKQKKPGFDRPISIIEYRLIKSKNNSYQIERGSKGLNWGDRGFSGVDLNGFATSIDATNLNARIEEEDFHQILDNIIFIKFQAITTNYYSEIRSTNLISNDKFLLSDLLESKAILVSILSSPHIEDDSINYINQELNKYDEFIRKPFFVVMYKERERILKGENPLKTKLSFESMLISKRLLKIKNF